MKSIFKSGPQHCLGNKSKYFSKRLKRRCFGSRAVWENVQSIWSASDATTICNRMWQTHISQLHGHVWLWILSVKQINLWYALFVVYLCLSSILWQDLLPEGSGGGGGGGGALLSLSAQKTLRTKVPEKQPTRTTTAGAGKGSQMLVWTCCGAVFPRSVGSSGCGTKDTSAICSRERK